MLRNILFAGTSLVILASAACSSDPDVEVFGDPSSSSSGSSQSSSGFSSGGASSGGINGCAGNEVSGKTQPVHLVMALDISGSMCFELSGNGTTCGNANSRWQLTLNALSTFFKSPTGKDVSVSVIPWSDPSNNCTGLGGFDQPISPKDVPLPDTSDSIATSIRALQPKGATPTKAAIEGAVRHANTLKGQLTDGGRVVIALVTDGEPTCGTSADAKAAAQAAKQAGFPVYVIGISDNAVSVDSVAEGGGTTKAFLVKNNVADEMNAALRDIKGAALSCATKLPDAPAGQALDLKQINVSLTVKGAQRVVPQSQDCSNPAGWRYVPDASRPTGIELCSSVCSEVTANLTDSKINIVLGCATVTAK